MGHRFRVAFWMLTLVCGIFLAWDARHFMDTDGISYLDIGDAYFKGDWANALNAFWSPLYSWLLGFAIFCLRPSPYWEFPTVHLVNFLIFLWAAGTFEFFLWEFLRFYQEKINERNLEGQIGLSENAVRVLGYSLFLWTSLHLVDLATVTPDLCVAALVYWTFGILLKIRRGIQDPLTFFGLGLVIAIGYFAKGTFFPLGLLFLTTSGFLIGGLRQSMPRVGAALLGFVLLAGPFIAALSGQKGRLTISDSGTTQYVTNIYQVNLDHWRGDEPPNSGVAKHPTRKIFEEPAAYEFATPVKGTYPVWYDPSYWRDGLRARFDRERQLRFLGFTLKGYARIFFGRWRWVLVLAVFLLFVLSGRRRIILKDLFEYWPLLLPTAVALGIYSVLGMEARRVAPFVALLWLILFTAVRFPTFPQARQILHGIVYPAIGLVLLSIVIPTAKAAWRGTGELIRQEYRLGHRPWEVASRLSSVGIGPGDSLALIGRGNVSSQWARLGRVRLVAEIPSAREFWDSEPKGWRKVIRALQQTGVQAVIAENIPDPERRPGWKRIGNTSYFAHRF